MLTYSYYGQLCVIIQQSMWVLPESEDNYSALETISQEIENNDGEILLMQSVFFHLKHEERVISCFNNLRDEEYKEVMQQKSWM